MLTYHVVVFVVVVQLGGREHDLRAVALVDRLVEVLLRLLEPLLELVLLRLQLLVLVLALRVGRRALELRAARRLQLEVRDALHVLARALALLLEPRDVGDLVLHAAVLLLHAEHEPLAHVERHELVLARVVVLRHVVEHDLELAVVVRVARHVHRLALDAQHDEVLERLRPARLPRVLEADDVAALALAQLTAGRGHGR